MKTVAGVRWGVGAGVLVIAAFGVMGTGHLYQRYEVGKHATEWLAWTGIEHDPISDQERVWYTLPEGTRQLSGVISYQNGQLRAAGARDLPMQSASVNTSGIMVMIEDPYRSEADDACTAYLPPQTRSKVLLARIVEINDEDVTLAYRYYHFKPGEPIALTLPYTIDIAEIPDPVRSDSLVNYNVSLGPLSASGRRLLISEDEWEEVLEDPSYLEACIRNQFAVSVEMAMDNGVQGVRYAEVSVRADGEPLIPVRIPEDHPMWRISLGTETVICEALATGMISFKFLRGRRIA